MTYMDGSYAEYPIYVEPSVVSQFNLRPELPDSFYQACFHNVSFAERTNIYTNVLNLSTYYQSSVASPFCYGGNYGSSEAKNQLGRVVLSSNQ